MSRGIESGRVRASGELAASEEAIAEVEKMDDLTELDLPEEREKTFRTPGFARMRLDWSSDDAAIIAQAKSAVEGRMAAIQAGQTTQARAIDDATLTDRVQSIVFRDEAVPKGDLNINVERGIVVLRGEVPDQEMRARIVSEVEGIEGVWSVRDLLHLPGEPAATAVAS